MNALVWMTTKLFDLVTKLKAQLVFVELKAYMGTMATESR
jgi:hypothetical protein